MNHDQPCAKRNLTPLYCLHQAAYFFAMSGVSAFAVTYLMGRGFDTALIGVMLATSNILSCVLQPPSAAMWTGRPMPDCKPLCPAA